MGCLASASNASAKEFNRPPPVFLATLAKFLIATSVLRSFNTLSIFDISFDTAANNAGSSKSSSPPPPLWVFFALFCEPLFPNCKKSRKNDFLLFLCGVNEASSLSSSRCASSLMNVLFIFSNRLSSSSSSPSSSPSMSLPSLMPLFFLLFVDFIGKTFARYEEYLSVNPTRTSAFIFAELFAFLLLWFFSPSSVFVSSILSKSKTLFVVALVVVVQLSSSFNTFSRFRRSNISSASCACL